MHELSSCYFMSFQIRLEIYSIACMVQRKICLIVWRNRIVELVYPILAVFVAPTNAECLLESADNAPQIKPLRDIVIGIAKTAEILGAECDGSDGAFRNLR